ncbi:MAG: hypothetical protein GQ569_02105 [Methylococcaceae bacterium]|nr:hypothetical protein [Methylococcaceae bacterium]
MGTIISLSLLFVVILAIFLAFSIGIAFVLVWLFPNISFEIAAVIGTVSSAFSVLAFTKLLSFSMLFDPLFKKYERDGLEEDYDIEEEYDEEGEDIYVAPTKSSSRKNRNRKRRR